MYLSCTFTEIVSVEYCNGVTLKCGLEVVQASRSLKMALIDKSRRTYNCSAIVTIALSCTIFELFDVEKP